MAAPSLKTYYVYGAAVRTSGIRLEKQKKKKKKKKKKRSLYYLEVSLPYTYM